MPSGGPPCLRARGQSWAAPTWPSQLLPGLRGDLEPEQRLHRRPVTSDHAREGCLVRRPWRPSSVSLETPVAPATGQVATWCCRSGRDEAGLPLVSADHQDSQHQGAQFQPSGPPGCSQGPTQPASCVHNAALGRGRMIDSETAHRKGPQKQASRSSSHFPGEETEARESSNVLPHASLLLPPLGAAVHRKPSPFAWRAAQYQPAVPGGAGAKQGATAD